MKTVIELAHEVYGKNTEWDGASLKRLEQLVQLVRADEREACAKVCDRMAQRTQDIRSAALESAAENIRARSNT